MFAETTQFGVLLPPEARARLKRGVDLMGNVLRATLGPTGRIVCVAPLVSTRMPELLTDAATIARRIIEVPDMMENMGAMLVRHVCWQVHEAVGDGTATTAVLTQAILAEADRRVAAGANAMFLKRGVERATECAIRELRAMARPLEGEQEITRVATAAAGDERLGKLIGEMLDILGPEGVILVEGHPQVILDREYVEGLRWDSGYVSPFFVTNTERMEAVVEDPLVLVTDLNLDTVEQVRPLLEQILEAHEARVRALNLPEGVQPEPPRLAVIANDIAGDALSTFVVNHQERRLRCVGIKAPSAGDHRVRIIEDIAILTGGRMISEDAGELLEAANLGDLGRARRVAATRDSFTVVGGAGSDAAVRDRLQEIKRQLKDMDTEYDRRRTRERLGKLSGGIGLLHVGAATERELEELKQRGESAIAATAAAVEEGVVPGGGAGFLKASVALDQLAAELGGDERLGVQVLARALEAPVYWIARNAGGDAESAVARARRLTLDTGRAHGYDGLADHVVDMEMAGILDPLKVARTVLAGAVSAALMALTTDALVLKKKPEQAVQP